MSRATRWFTFAATPRVTIAHTRAIRARVYRRAAVYTLPSRLSISLARYDSHRLILLMFDAFDAAPVYDARDGDARRYARQRYFIIVIYMLFARVLCRVRGFSLRRAERCSARQRVIIILRYGIRYYFDFFVTSLSA